MANTNSSIETEDIYGDLDDLNLNIDLNAFDDNISIHSNETEIPSDAWLDEKDILTLSFIEGAKAEHESVFSNNNELNWKSTSVNLKESLLKKKEIELLNEIFVAEEEEKKSKQNDEKECEKLRREIEKMRKQISKKNEEISELSTQNANLKKNICSLYKTAKSEIDQKDTLLHEANKKLDRALMWCRERGNQLTVTPSAVQDEPRAGGQSTSYNYRNRNVKSRKRSLSPTEKKSEQHGKQQKKTNLLSKNNHHSASQNAHSKYDSSNVYKTGCVNQKTTEIVSHGSKVVARETENNVLQNDSVQRDLTKTDAVFFKLLPDVLRKAFQEYERTQMVSMNRLKQAFVNYCLSDLSSSSSNELSFPDSVIDENISNLLRNNEFEKHLFARVLDTEKKSSMEERGGEILESTKTDILKLYMYRKEKLPFLVKRHLGLLKKHA